MAGWPRGLGWTLHDLGHFVKAHRLFGDDLKKIRRDIREGSDVGACWVALELALELQCGPRILEWLEAEYDESVRREEREQRDRRPRALATPALTQVL